MFGKLFERVILLYLIVSTNTLMFTTLLIPGSQSLDLMTDVYLDLMTLQVAHNILFII